MSSVHEQPELLIPPEGVCMNVGFSDREREFNGKVVDSGMMGGWE